MTTWFRNLASLGLIAAGLVGLACQTDVTALSSSSPGGNASVARRQATDETNEGVSLEALRGMLPAHAGWMSRTTMDHEVSAGRVRVVRATYRSSERDYLKLAIHDGHGAVYPGSSSSIQRAGFEEQTPDCGHRVLWRGNPPGADAGGLVRVLVGDQFLVEAEGNRLTLETIATAAHDVAHRLAALAPEPAP